MAQFEAADRILALEARIRELEEASDPKVPGDILCKIISHDEAHEIAFELGYPSVLEALEALAAPQSTGAQPMTTDELRELLADCEARRENETDTCHWARVSEAHRKLNKASKSLAAEVLRLREMVEALNWFSGEQHLELSFGALQGGDLHDCAWLIYSVHGGYNDREWTFIAHGETALEAVTNARAALKAQEPNP